MTTTELENPAADLDNLLNRIDQSVNNEAATSSNAARLCEQALQMIDKIRAHEKLMQQQMLEPLLPREQIEEAKRSVEAAAIDTQRLEAAIELLRGRKVDLTEHENAARKAQRYAKAQEYRDEVAKRIKDRFPAIHAEYLGLIESIMQSNAEVDAANADLPDGMPALNRPEGEARGFKDYDGYNYRASYETFRITQTMLPSPISPVVIDWPKVRIYGVGILEQRKGISQPSVISLWKKSKR